MFRKSQNAQFPVWKFNNKKLRFPTFTGCSGFGIELTMKVRKMSNSRDEPIPCWPINILQFLARYVFESWGFFFRLCHHANFTKNGTYRTRLLSIRIGISLISKRNFWQFTCISRVYQEIEKSLFRKNFSVENNCWKNSSKKALKM